MGDDETDHRLEDDRGHGEQHGLLDDHPERVALEQELEIPEADEFRHRLVQRRQMHRIERRIHDQAENDQDQRQRKEKRDHGLAADKSAGAYPSPNHRNSQVARYGIGHAKGLLILAPAALTAAGQDRKSTRLNSSHLGSS